MTSRQKPYAAPMLEELGDLASFVRASNESTDGDNGAPVPVGQDQFLLPTLSASLN